MDELFEDFSKALIKSGIDFDTRFKIYSALETLTEDDHSDLLEIDDAFDAVVEEKHPSWFDGEDPTHEDSCND